MQAFWILLSLKLSLTFIVTEYSSFRGMDASLSELLSRQGTPDIFCKCLSTAHTQTICAGV